MARSVTLIAWDDDSSGAAPEDRATDTAQSRRHELSMRGALRPKLIEAAAAQLSSHRGQPHLLDSRGSHHRVEVHGSYRLAAWSRAIATSASVRVNGSAIARPSVIDTATRSSPATSATSSGGLGGLALSSAASLSTRGKSSWVASRKITGSSDWT